MPDSGTVTLSIRGRGLRKFAPEQTLLVSKAGDGIPIETPVGQVRAGDWVGIRYGGTWSELPAALPFAKPRATRGSEKKIRTPEVMSTELAFLLGAYLAEGHTTRSNWSVILTNSVEEVLIRAQQAWWDVFGLRARITRQPDRCMGLVVSSKRLVEFMDLMECGGRASHKRVPRFVLEGRRDHALTFLQGAALDGYVSHTGAAKWAICLESHAAIDGLQDLLTKLGIVNAQIGKYNRTYDKTYFELYAAGAQGQEVCRVAPFLEPDKLARAEAYLGKAYGVGAADVIPGIDGPSLYRLIPQGRSGCNGRGTGRAALSYLRDPRTRMVTRRSFERVEERGAVLPPWVQTILRERIRFAPAVSPRSSCPVVPRS